MIRELGFVVESSESHFVAKSCRAQGVGGGVRRGLCLRNRRAALAHKLALSSAQM